MGFPILVRCHLYIESRPRTPATIWWPTVIYIGAKCILVSHSVMKWRNPQMMKCFITWEIIEARRIYASMNWTITDQGNGMLLVWFQAVTRESMLAFCHLDIKNRWNWICLIWDGGNFVQLSTTYNSQCITGEYKPVANCDHWVRCP